MTSNIPLTVLVCDPNEITASALTHQLTSHEAVTSVQSVDGITGAQRVLRTDDINTVFIDPLATDLEKATDFVFSVRKSLPEIVFALYMDVSAAEAQRKEFYRGERQRFSHYYTLDKSIPVPSFPGEVDSVLRTCQADLSWRLSRETLKRIAEQSTAPDAADASSTELQIHVDELVNRVSISRQSLPKSNSVFLSYRFVETEYADGLIPLLNQFQNPFGTNCR